ncbi:methylenetetrahydrofolate reductase [Elysia marginata]|uniref:Methylenetetrahydrofolate reductase n=1 Tax=Elysia marginata TaxID=1093978 RepID=A0AAV4G609_9GAST|nr:methylenetetrahydrofolate reductase [Elysia marginata]
MKVTEHIQNAGGKTLFSFEIIPPLKGKNIKELYDNIDPLMEFTPPFIDVTTSREEYVYLQKGDLLEKKITRMRPGTLGICASIKHKYNVDTVPHVLCGGFTKEETEYLLVDCHYLGITNVMALRGDSMKGDQYFIPTKGGNKHAIDLVGQISNLNRGKYLHNVMEVDMTTNFCVGVAGYPEKHIESPSLKTDLKRLKEKVDAGADYVVTQMFFDNFKYIEFLKTAREMGIEIPIIPGIKPIATKQHLRVLPQVFKIDIPEMLVTEVEKCRDNKQIRVNKELIIRANSSSIDFALLQAGKLVELHKQSREMELSVGDILFAKVRRVVSGLSAAFVDVGSYDKEGFLHYTDLGPNIRSSLIFLDRVISSKIKNGTIPDDLLCQKAQGKDGDISEVLKSKQNILVQIVKEPISTKGPRLSGEISIAGRYLILVPFSDKVTTSQKINSLSESKRLKQLIKSIKPKGFGVIIRTAAVDKKVADLDSDMSALHEKWVEMCKKLPKVSQPTKVLREVEKAFSIIRDIFDDTFSGIYVDNKALFGQVKSYVGEIDPDKACIVKHFNSIIPIFEKFGIERQIKASFGRIVMMHKGAYLVIEHTEALHVIDVNSGGRSNKSKTQQDTALSVNLVAAEEIAKQLRLRDMGEEDTPKLLKQYAEKHGAIPGKWNLLTGGKAQIYDLARKSYLVAKKGKDKGDFIHTENIVLVDKKKRIRGFYNGTKEEEVKKLIADISILGKE